MSPNDIFRTLSARPNWGNVIHAMPAGAHTPFRGGIK
jgi:hypothetical protein